MLAFAFLLTKDKVTQVQAWADEVVDPDVAAGASSSHAEAPATTTTRIKGKLPADTKLDELVKNMWKKSG